MGETGFSLQPFPNAQPMLQAGLSEVLGTGLNTRAQKFNPCYPDPLCLLPPHFEGLGIICYVAPSTLFSSGLGTDWEGNISLGTVPS